MYIMFGDLYNTFLINIFWFHPQEYEMVIPNDQCCGECVQTKCKSDNGTLYAVGEMWKSKDTCTFYECVERTSHKGVSVYSYRKSCAKLDDCPPHQIVTHDCCPTCDRSKRANDPIDVNKGR